MTLQTTGTDVYSFLSPGVFGTVVTTTAATGSTITLTQPASMLITSPVTPIPWSMPAIITTSVNGVDVSQLATQVKQIYGYLRLQILEQCLPMSKDLVNIVRGYAEEID